MAPMMFPAGDEIADLVAGKEEMRVLDIAAGHGLFGILVAQHNPKAQITALDWPNVLAVATENAEKFGVATRHSLLPGSAFETEFGGPYNLVLVTNFFHHFDQPTREKLMRKILAANVSRSTSSRMMIVSRRPIPAAFAMVMLGTTAAGDAYTFAEYESMFRNAGFTSFALHSLNRPS